MSLLGDIGGIVGGFLGFEGQEDTNETNAMIAAQNRQFQEAMRATQYQTAVTDMKSAGLNPMLAYSQGGAGNLPGSTAVMQNSAAAGISSAMQALQMANIDEQNKKIRAETENVKADTEVKSEQVPKVRADAQVSEQTIRLVEEQARKVATEERNLNVERDILKNNVVHTEYRAIREKYETLLTMFDYKNLAPEKARQMKATAQLLELEIPKALNEAAAEDTAFKKYVSPFLSDVGKSVGSAAQAAGTMRGLRMDRYIIHGR